MKTIATLSRIRILLLLTLILMSLQPEAQILFQGLVSENEGSAAWNADGSGLEPAGTGHGTTLYYIASRDYVDNTANYGGHATSVNSGFAGFSAAITSGGFTLSQLKIKVGLASQGNQVQGTDWFTFPTDEHYMTFLPFNITFTLNGWPLISGTANYMIFHQGPSTSYAFHCISNHFKPTDISTTSPVEVKAVAAALLQDIGAQELRIRLQTLGASVPFTANGRSGSYWNIQGALEMGLPWLPFRGLAADHQGFAGWDANGLGPEPKANGHGDARYYIASREYDDIDPDTTACFIHLVSTGWEGFQHFALQLRNRNFTPDQLRFTMSVRNMGEDIQGEDWNTIGNIYSANFYHSVIMATLNGEEIFGFVCDTVKICFDNNNPLAGWYGTSAFTPFFDASENSSTAVQAVAAAFFRDMEDRQVSTKTVRCTAAPGVISSNGRTGGFWQIDSLGLKFSSGPGTTVPPGNVSGQWTKAGHPYIVTGDITVPDGQTLTIDPGVWVKFTGRTHFAVLGNIQAIGDDSNNGGIVFTAVHPELGWGHIEFDSTAATNPTSAFKYCTFEYGSAPPPVPLNSPYNCGGAMAIRNFDKVHIDHCLFQYNRATFDGATLYADAGAIALWTSSPRISNSVFRENSAHCNGAISCYLGSSPDIINCLFYKNLSSYNYSFGGGAILIVDQSNPKLINNAFFRNISNLRGGAIEINDDSDPKLINNIFWSNSAPTGKQISITSGNCNIDLKFNNIQGGLSGIGPYGTGSGQVSDNMDADPGFADTLALDFRNKNTSPCVDAGIPDVTGLNLPPDDLLGNIRVWNGGSGTTRIDLGPYEFNAPLYTGIHEGQPPSSSLELKAYPVPFTSELNLQFLLKDPGTLTITLSNDLGQLISSELREYTQAGNHTVTLNTEGLLPGLYLCRILTDRGFLSSKVLKINRK